MKLTLEGRAALVTGANGGLGSHFARDAGQGRREGRGGCARRSTRCARWRCDRGGGRPRRTDRARRDRSCERGARVRAGSAALGPITVVVNNAGIAVTKPLLEHTEEDWQQVIEVNLNGAWRVAQAAARHMVKHEQGGSIVNIASILGLRVSAQVPSYAASKAALIQLTKAMALELARYKIRVNALAPGLCRNRHQSRVLRKRCRDRR